MTAVYGSISSSSYDECKIDLSGCKISQIMMYFCRDKKLHIGFDDPDAFSGHEEQVIEEFRRVRDEIRSEMSKL